MQSATTQNSQHGTPVQVRLHPDLFEAVESWRRGQESIPSRPEAIRRLLRKSLLDKLTDVIGIPNAGK